MANPFGVQRPVAAVPQMGSTLIPPRRRVLAHLAENPELLRELYAEADNPFSQGANSPEALYYKLFAGKGEGLADLMIGSAPGATLNWRADPGQVTNSLARTRPRAGRQIPRSRRPAPAEPLARTARPAVRPAKEGRPWDLAPLLQDPAATKKRIADVFGRGHEENPSFLSEEVLLALELMRRQEAGLPIENPTRQMDAYAESLVRDVEAMVRGENVTKEERQFYPRAAKSFQTQIPKLGRVMRGHGTASAFTEDFLADPALTALKAALSVQLSAQSSPKSESFNAAELLPRFSDRFGGGRRRMTAQEALFGIDPSGEPVGAAWGQEGTWNPGTHLISRYGKAGESLFPSYETVARLIDEQPGSQMKKLLRASQWFQQQQSLDDIHRLGGEELKSRANPWDMYTGGTADVIPQAITRVGNPAWPEKARQLRLPGWFLLDPKKGAYAEQQATGEGDWYVFDQQAKRAKQARLGGNFLVNGRPISDEDLANLIEAVAGIRRMGEEPDMAKVLGTKTKRGLIGKTVVVPKGPAGAASRDREIYQHGMQEAAKVLDPETRKPLGGEVQPIDWFGMKGILGLADTGTPGGGGVYEGHKAALDNARRTGKPYGDPRTKKVLSVKDAVEYQKKGKLTAEEADAAARDQGFETFRDMKADYKAKTKKRAAAKAKKRAK